jgi:hypothetical protein
MTPHSLSATTECGVCGGPCREPFRLPRIHDDYPFLPPEVILQTQREHDGYTPPDAKVERRERRSHRLAEDRMVRLSEDRAHRPGEDR